MCAYLRVIPSPKTHENKSILVQLALSSDCCLAPVPAGTLVLLIVLVEWVDSIGFALLGLHPWVNWIGCDCIGWEGNTMYWHDTRLNYKTWRVPDRPKCMTPDRLQGTAEVSGSAGAGPCPPPPQKKQGH